jgi:pimeloyl-ACP methyl ester carboxylesterase
MTDLLKPTTETHDEPIDGIGSRPLRSDLERQFRLADNLGLERRRFLGGAAVGLAAVYVASATPAAAQAIGATNTIGTAAAPGASKPLKRMEPLKNVAAGVLSVAYYEVGPADGPVALLLHGFPYDIHSYADVAPLLAARGMRVIVPYSRGYAPTRFLETSTIRSGEQAALGADVIALMDALKIERAVIGGYDWGARAANIAAALYPNRCIGLVSVNSYQIQNIAKNGEPTPPSAEIPLWYQYYFHGERGRAGLAKYRREIARILWTQWSPNWKFDDATFDRAAVAFDSPDYVDTIVHCYRHKFGLVRRSLWMALATASWRLLRMASQRRGSSPAAARIASLPELGTTYRKKHLKHSRRLSRNSSTPDSG